MYSYNREDLIFGIVFIGVGVIIFIFALWSEPIANPSQFPNWFFLTFRVLALVCVVVGIIGIIASLIPSEKHKTKMENKQKASTGRHCPKCGREIPFDAMICPYCKYDFK
jgi:hypothetical protein